MLGEERRVVGISRNIYTGNVYPHYAALDPRIREKKLPAPGNWDFVNLESVVALKAGPGDHLVPADRGHRFPGRQGDSGFRGVHPAQGGRLPGNRGPGEADRQPQTGRGAHRLYEEGTGPLRLPDVGAFPTVKRPGVYYMWAQGNLETSCGESTVNDLIQLAGGRNVCAALPQEHLVVNLEKVFSWDPDLILMWYNEKKDPLDIIQDPQWKRIKAVRDRRVHEFPEVFWCDLWTLKFLYAVKLTAKWVHPELFRDIDLEQEKQKMMQFFYGKSRPVDS